MARYKLAIEQNPDHHLALHNIAFVHWLRKEWQPAYDASQRAIAINPGQKESFLIRAIARANLGDLDGAYSDHTTAIGLDANYVEAYINRAEVQMHKGQHQGAIDDSSRAIELFPTHAAMAYVHALRGHAYAKLGDKEHARSDFERSLALDPNEKIAKDGLAGLGA
jgi:tetratricopeptide (TPR) repeat protein